MVSPASPNGAIATQEAPQVAAPEVVQTPGATPSAAAPEVDYKARTEQLEADKADLESQGRPVLTFNKIKPLITLLSQTSLMSLSSSVICMKPSASF